MLSEPFSSFDLNGLLLLQEYQKIGPKLKKRTELEPEVIPHEYQSSTIITVSELRHLDSALRIQIDKWTRKIKEKFQRTEGI
jgi:hypothetical protein